MGVKNSWIDFITNDVPDIKVWYDMLISGRNLINTKEQSK